MRRRSGRAEFQHPVPHLMSSLPARSGAVTWTWFRSLRTGHVSWPRFMRRCPLPSPGSLRLVPLLQRYYETLRLPADLPAALRFLRLAVPSPAPAFVSPSKPDAGLRAWSFVPGCSHARCVEMEPQDLPGSWGTPIVPLPCS